LTRKTARLAIEKLSDCLYTDINRAKVARLDVSTVIPTKRQPADYYSYLGQKPNFTRLQVHADTLQYNNHQRQMIFYDKTKEAKSGNVSIPEIFANNYLFRYEFRHLKRLNNQFRQVVTAESLTDKEFYNAMVQNWYNEFKTIQKIINQSFMIENVKTVKEAEMAYYAYLSAQSGQSTIDNFLNELRANNTFKERPRYSELKRKLYKTITAQKGEQNELMKELEKKIFQVKKYAM
jgi:hypothetical protein